MEQTRRQERAAKCGGQQTAVHKSEQCGGYKKSAQDMKPKSPGKTELKVNQALASMEINDDSD